MDDSIPTINDKAIPDSEIEKLRLRIAIRGVSYRRNDDGRAGVTVLLEANFVLPEGKVVGYARLPFESNSLSGSTLKLQVEALTPDGDEVACLGVYTKETTQSRTPTLKLSAPPGVSFECSGLGNNQRTAEEAHHHILLTGYSGITGYSGTKPHWEFNNPLRIYYPKQIFLLAEFSSNHADDTPFPFLLRFNSNCQVTFFDRLLNAWRHTIGLPSQRIEFKIPGRYKEAEVQKYIDDERAGIVAAVKKAHTSAHSEQSSSDSKEI